MHLSVDQAVIEVEIAEFKCEHDTLEVAYTFSYLEDMLSSYGSLSDRQSVLGLTKDVP